MSGTRSRNKGRKGGARSRRRGQRGERQVRDVLRIDGWSADRTIQSRGGGKEISDLKTNFPYHVEVKYQERLNIWDAIKQARLDSNNKLPYIVVFRRNHEEWHVIVPIDEFLKLFNNQCQTKKSVEWCPSSTNSESSCQPTPTQA